MKAEQKPTIFCNPSISASKVSMEIRSSDLPSRLTGKRREEEDRREDRTGILDLLNLQLLVPQPWPTGLISWPSGLPSWPWPSLLLFIELDSFVKEIFENLKVP